MSTATATNTGKVVQVIGSTLDAEFQVLRSAVEQAILRRNRPQQQIVMQAPAAPDLADQLGRLAALRDQGVLTSEEFDAQKARLLA